MASVLPEGRQSFTDAAGAPLVGGKLYTYDAGTSTPRVTYADAAGTVPNTNPVVLDARGEATIFWDGVYKVVLKDAADATIWTIDGVATPEPAGSAAALAADLASTAAGKGAALSGFGWATIPAAINKADWGIQTARNGINALRYIPPSLWSQVAAGTYALPLDAYFSGVVSSGQQFYFPAGRYPFTNLSWNNLSNLRITGDGKTASLIIALNTGAAANPCWTFNCTGGVDNVSVALENIGILGNGLTGASGNGHALAFINVRGTGFAPQRLTLQSVHIEGFKGTGKDKSAASMPACGIYGYLGTGWHFEDVSIYNCAYSESLDSVQKAYHFNCLYDVAQYRGAHLLNCESIEYFGGVINDAGSGGATDGAVVPQGCSHISFFATRLKNGYPALVNSQSTTFQNNGVALWDCDLNQLDGQNIMVNAGTGDNNLRIKGGRMKWANTTTAGVGVLVGNGPGGIQMTGLDVDGVAASIGSGGTILAFASVQNSTGVVQNPRFKFTYGDGSAVGSPTTVINGILLNGIIDTPVIDTLTIHAGANNTVTNCVNFAAAPGNMINALILNPVYRTTGGGVITNQIVNTTGITITQLANGVVSSGNIRADKVSVGVAGTTTIGGTTAATVGAAGGASALPATPLGYLIGHVGTTQVKIPYYNA